MTPVLSVASFGLSLVLYGGAILLFFVEVARLKAASLGVAPRHDPLLRPAGREGSSPAIATGGAGGATGATPGVSANLRIAAILLGLAAAGHATYVTIASFVAHVCPVHSVHFMLSVASLLAIAVYLGLRRRFRIDALGILIAPLGLAFLLGTWFLGKPGPEPKLSPGFIALHVMANLLGVALFLLAGGAALLYLLQERRIKNKRTTLANLPPLQALDHAVHRFLIAGFPLLTLGIITGTFWARHLETGTPDEVMRIVFGYATWLLFAAVLLLRAAAGWRGRRSAYGTLAGFVCAAAVLVVYLVRPALSTVGG
jgi:ABC-type uncharacterized transport system permease subunit